MTKEQMLRQAEVNLKRARKCRELIALLDNREALAILETYAVELEVRAHRLMLDAAASLPKTETQPRKIAGVDA
jgi:hypothetical protein